MDVEKLRLLKDFLTDIESLKIPTPPYYQMLANGLVKTGIMPGITAQRIPSLFDMFKSIANEHNLYLDTLSKYNLSKVVNNYTMHSMYETINDPVNLIQAQTSVDGTTGPLKSEANKSSEAKEASTRTPGNIINKYEGIVENQVGKKGIAICATGLKSFFGLTQYYNYLLNYGTEEEQERILLGKDHKGIMIGGKVYKTLANIRSKDPNTIIKPELMEALASVTNDNDAALILSALLSLATDNAKELALSKLNASTKTLGLYVYGISIGMDFKDLAHIMMSDVGRVINEVLSDDVFAERDGYGTVDDALFKYFDEGPKKLLYKFDITKDSQGQTIPSPLEKLQKLAEEAGIIYEDDKGKPIPFTKALVEFSRENLHLSEKLATFEKMRRQYRSQSSEGKQLFNQLIDAVQDYIQQNHVIGLNLNVYEDIKTLSKGAAEMKILGQLFGLNKGLKTNPDGLASQINNIERAIYNQTGNLDDLIDLSKFVFDEDYRQECILKYEEVKHSFNILDAIAQVPHFMGYVQTLAIAAKEAQNSFKFRSARALSLKLAQELGYKKIGTTAESRIIKGVQNFIGDYLRKNWMLDKEISFVIPAGNKMFTKTGDQIELTQDTRVQLGTDWGDATFRMWMENEIIPNLKKGIIKPGTTYEAVADNKFVKDLGNNLYTRTVSHNPTIISTLPINMLPRIDQERAIFNTYKSAFNELAGGTTQGGLSYQYEYTVNSEDGTQVTQLSKPIPLVDLFTYYAMIANGWKLSESSLVPILEDFQNTGEIQSFHEYVTAIDKSGETLTIDNIEFFEILPYIAPFESPYVSRSKYIQYRNPSTRKLQLMQRLSRSELAIDVDPEFEIEGLDAGRIKEYEFITADVDTNYYPTGRQESPSIKKTFSYEQNGRIQEYEIVYDKETGKLQRFEVFGTQLTLGNFDLTHVPVIKGDGGRKLVNTTLLEMLINDKLNPCS